MDVAAVRPWALTYLSQVHILALRDQLWRPTDVDPFYLD